VALTADDFRLDQRPQFGVDVWPQLNSDPGGSDYWTIEVVWLEHEVEQRLNMYFGSDGTDWWVDEIRTYDGYDPGEWVYAYGPFFQAPLGEAFEADVRVELLGTGARASGQPRAGRASSPACVRGVAALADPAPGAICSVPDRGRRASGEDGRRGRRRSSRPGQDGTRDAARSSARSVEVLADQDATVVVEVGSGVWNEGCGTIGSRGRDVIIQRGCIGVKPSWKVWEALLDECLMRPRLSRC
jgi:hypothetical protein